MLHVRECDLKRSQQYGGLSRLRALARKSARDTDQRWLILLADGRLEVYYGTSATKQGWTKTTYDPHFERKRPGIPQYMTLA